MDSTIPRIPILRFKPGSLLAYEEIDQVRNRSTQQKLNEKNLTRGVFNGKLSVKALSRIRGYLGTWLQGVKELQSTSAYWTMSHRPYITFITLTLSSSQIVSDQVVKRKVLIPFIQELCRVYWVRHYYWYAEAQSNGNIHFHLLIDRYVNWRLLRDCWNKHQNTLGYIDDFELKHGHRDPNSTDIHRLRDIEKVESYVMKYISKPAEYRLIDGRIHGRSDKLDKLKPFETVMDSVETALYKDLRALSTSKKIDEEEYSVVIADVWNFTRQKYPQIFNLWRQHLISSVYNLYVNSDEWYHDVKSKIDENYEPVYIPFSLPEHDQLSLTF